MSGFARFAIAITGLMSFFGVMTSTASAVTWHNTGSTSFTATAGPNTFTFGSSTLSCAGGQVTGTVPGGSTVGAVYSVSGTAIDSGCTFAGQTMYVHCNFTLTAFSQSGSVTAGNTVETCVLKLTASNQALCVLTGPVSGTYTNPIGATPGRATLFASNTLTVSNPPGGGSCPAGTGPASVTHKTGTVSSGTPTPFGPIITRTP
jgi:hypothetical protein